MLGLLSLLIAPAAKAGPSVLFDAATGEVISHERAGEPWYPASLTKLMTAYIVFKKLKAGSLRLDQKIMVTPLAASQEPSKIGLKPGSDGIARVIGGSSRDPTRLRSAQRRWR